MGKPDQQEAKELLYRERNSVLEVAFAYISIYGLPLDHPDEILDERLRLVTKALAAK